MEWKTLAEVVMVLARLEAGKEQCLVSEKTKEHL